MLTLPYLLLTDWLQCKASCSSPKQAQRPKEDKGKTPGLGAYRLKPNLHPLFNSSRLTSPRITFPIAPKDQSEKAGLLLFKRVFC